MQMRHLLPFQIKARPQRGIGSKHLSAPAMRQIAVVCHARKIEQLSRPSCRQALNAVCHQRSSPLRNARCRRYAHTEHCYAYGCCVCSVCCSTLSSTQQAIGPICAGRYALDRGRFGRSNASLRCPVTAACPEIRQGGSSVGVQACVRE